MVIRPKVSILMPVRDDEATLPECLQSILDQTLKEWEMVLVDDGSSDGSRELLACAGKDDKRIRVITTPPKGIVQALNTGISVCSGHYIARMDADDRMLPQRLERQLALMESHPEIDFCGCLVEPFNNEGTVSENVKKYHRWSNSLLTDEQIRCDLFVESPIMHPTFFAPRKLFEFLGGYLEYPWAEDYDLLLRAASQKVRFGKCPQILLEKRHGQNRLSRIDPIYKRPAMMRAKVHYLLETGILDKFQGVLIIGTGPTGRELARAFIERGVTPAGFIDNRSGPPDRRVLGYRAWGFPEGVPKDFLLQFTDQLIVLGIGDREKQAMMANLLREIDLIENQSFLKMA